MGMPLLLGAGIGAIGSAAMGKSPIQGALLGGATGGLLGGSDSLFGAKIADAFGSAATPSAGIVGSTGEVGSSLLQSVNPATGALTNAGAIPLTAMDKTLGALNKVTAPFENFAAQNPYTAKIGGNIATSEAMNMLSPQPSQRMPDTPAPPIHRTAPQVMGDPNTPSGMISLKTELAKNPDLIRLYPNLFGGY